jgi:hypothetical protein
MKALVLLWLRLVAFFKHDPTLDAWGDVASDSKDERLMALCRDAHANGWRFATWSEGLRAYKCGCPFQAVAWLRALKEEDWSGFSAEFGIERPSAWGVGFDHAITGFAVSGIPVKDQDPDYEFGARIARRLKAEGLA